MCVYDDSNLFVAGKSIMHFKIRKEQYEHALFYFQNYVNKIAKKEN